MKRPLAPPAVFAALGIAAAGFCLRLAGATSRSLNTDEVYFALAARQGAVWRSVLADVHPPLYQLFLSGLMRLGFSETAWRLASALCWVGAGLFAWRLGRRLAGETVGLLALALLMVAPQGYSLSLMVRTYAPATLLASWMMCEFAALIDQPDRRRTLRLAVAAALASYCFYYNLLLLAGLAAAGWRLRRQGRAAGKRALQAAGLAGLLFAPWLPLLLAQYRNSLGAGWLELTASPRELLRRTAQLLAQAAGVDGVETAVRAVAPWAAGACGTALIFVLLAWGYGRLRRAEPAEARGRLFAVALPVAATVALALVAHTVFHAFFALHYFTILAAPVAVLAVAPFALARRGFVAGALFAVLLAADVFSLPAAARVGDEPLRPAVQWIDARLGPDDLGLGVAWFAADAYRFYGAGRAVVGVPIDLRSAGDRPAPRVQPGIATAADLERLRPLLARPARVALLLTHENWRETDRGVALIKQALTAAGFTAAEKAAWPPFATQPPVRAEIWRRPPGTEAR